MGVSNVRRLFSLCLLVLLLFPVSCCMTRPRPPRESWKVMSFNIRYGTARDGLNSWPLRKDLLLRTLEDAAPDLLGVQEALSFQLDAIQAHLGDYERVGVGRDDGRQAGEHSAILYNPARLRVLSGGTFWLSETPGITGSKSWGNGIPRICSWARLESQQTGVQFHVFNTHFDHQSQPARLESARLILNRIERHAKGGPVILMGDFNAGETNPAYLELVTNRTTPLEDSFRGVHPQATEVGTFNGFEGRTAGEKIDGILMSPHWALFSAGINRTAEGERWPSDHFPVEAELGL